MQKFPVAIALIAVVGLGGIGVFAANRCEHSSSASSASGGNVAGHFDAAMSGVCRFACATKTKYERKDVVAQPGALSGQFVQCPVSGVVFAVDADRPHVRVANADYVTCCGECATKLERDPRHYLKV